MSKHILDKILEHHRQVAELLQHRLGGNYTDADIVEFYQQFKKTNLLGNTAIARKVVDYYQLLDENQHLVERSFSTISSIYDLMLSVQPYDLALYESAFFFFSNVMDDVKKAKSILETGISAAEGKISELRRELNNV